MDKEELRGWGAVSTLTDGLVHKDDAARAPVFTATPPARPMQGLWQGRADGAEGEHETARRDGRARALVLTVCLSQNGAVKVSVLFSRCELHLSFNLCSGNRAAKDDGRPQVHTLSRGRTGNACLVSGFLGLCSDRKAMLIPGGEGGPRAATAKRRALQGRFHVTPGKYTKN